MEHYLIVARSVTYAQRMQRALERAGIFNRIFRAPRELGTVGCAYVVQVRASDLAAALEALYRAELNPVSVYLSQGGLYQEVAL